MALQGMRDAFVASDNIDSITEPVTRRGALRLLGLSFAGASALAVMPSILGGNDAHAGEAQAATATQPEITGEKARPSHMMREMRNFSKDPDTKGIGVFINLQADAPEGYGDKIGQRLQEVFVTRDIPLQYRTNKSRGTATDITFYVKGYDFTYNIDDIGSSLGKVLAHHGDVWPAKTASLDSAAPTKQ